MPTRKVVEYLGPEGSSPFQRWFQRFEVVLLGGGTKKRQNDDLQLVQQRWRDDKARKKR